MENDNKIKPIDLSKRKYNIKEIDHGVYCQTANISNNEKYLAYGSKLILKIYDIKEGRIIKELRINGYI